MLPKHQRLNLKKDFKWVVAGKTLETKYLKIFVKFGDNQLPRLGIAVSGRSFQKAVLRNKARRLASSAFEALYSKFPSNTNIVALPKASILGVKSSDVLLDLEKGLKREEII